MTSNFVIKIISYLQRLIVYNPPRTPKSFVLTEQEAEAADDDPSHLSKALAEFHTLLRYARRLKTTIEQAVGIIQQEPAAGRLAEIRQLFSVLEAEKAELSPVRLAYDSESDPAERNVSVSLKENILIIEKVFQFPHNKDIIIREFAIPANPPRKAMLLFTKGLIDEKTITTTVLMPLFSAKQAELSDDILSSLIINYLPSHQASQTKAFSEVVKAVSGGYSALFVEGADGAILIYTKGYERRAIGRPMIEQTIRGSQAAFTETLQTNIALVRLALRSPDLVTETITLGKRGKVDCAVMYLQSVVNPDLVAEVKRRLGNISTDYIAAGTLEQFIEDHPAISIPQILSTERPDRVSSHLAEGRIAILLEGDPFVLVVPVSLFTLFHSPEDFALKKRLGTFIRVVRLISAYLAIVVPSFYIAVTYYHPQAVPTELILAIAGARERIPFPAIIEVLFMEFSLEFIREASTRKPGLLGETLGIVGGIILGQTVATANLVSPVTVVVVAVTAIATFAIPDYRMSMAIRMIQFIFLTMGFLWGLVGVASGLFLLTLFLCSMKSFGVPFLAPIGPKTIPGLDIVVRGPVYRQEKRPDELNTLDSRRQPETSRKWVKKQPAGDETTDEL